MISKFMKDWGNDNISNAQKKEKLKNWALSKLTHVRELSLLRRNYIFNSREVFMNSVKTCLIMIQIG